MFEQTFKNIDDILYKDSGADSELDYIGQTSWVMFLSLGSCLHEPPFGNKKFIKKMFEQTFKNIDDILYKDSGADSELDYIGQTSWIMFLRYLDNLEQDKADAAALEGKKYTNILEKQFRWTNWQCPKMPKEN